MAYSNERWVRREQLYTGRVVNMCAGEVELDDGVIAHREVVEHPGGVGVVPFDGESVILVRQFRIAINKPILEIPAGKLEPGDNPERRGRLELEEEAGYRAGRMLPAGAVYASCGYTSELIHLFLALDLTKTAQRCEHDERIDIVRIPLDELRTRISRLELEDAKTVIGVEALFRHLAGNGLGHKALR